MMSLSSKVIKKLYDYLARRRRSRFTDRQTNQSRGAHQEGRHRHLHHHLPSRMDNNKTSINNQDNQRKDKHIKRWRGKKDKGSGYHHHHRWDFDQKEEDHKYATTNPYQVDDDDDDDDDDGPPPPKLSSSSMTKDSHHHHHHHHHQGAMGETRGKWWQTCDSRSSSQRESQSAIG